MKAAPAHRFIDPRHLAAIADLELVARTIAEGFMVGMHPGRITGAGLEFNQYRSYQPGDDLKRLDWKMFARSDRYYVRESELESRIAIRFVLDASGSMLHEDHGIRKFDYARFAVAALGYLACLQGDAIGLTAIHRQGITSIEPRHERYQLHRFLGGLEDLEAGGRWPQWEVLEKSFAEAKRRQLLIWVSDFSEHGSEIRTAIRKVAAYHHELSALHIVARNELEFDYGDATAYEDLETGEVVHTSPAEARESYIAQLDEYIIRLQTEMSELEIDYQRFPMDQPLDYVLRHYLKQRTLL